jgi:hypothetical protein
VNDGSLKLTNGQSQALNTMKQIQRLDMQVRDFSMAVNADLCKEGEGNAGQTDEGLSRFQDATLSTRREG